LRLAKSSHVCRMKASELPVGIFGETNEDISLMAATRQLRRAAHRWREMSGDWQMESEQPSWDLTREQWHTLGGAHQSVTRAARLLWDKGIRDVRTITRESLLPALRPLLPQQLLFLEETLGNPQDTTFGRTEGGRSGTQEMTVWAPRLKQLRDRDHIMLQNILDLTDWRGLHMTSTPGTVQRSTEWAVKGRSQGSVLKVTSTVSTYKPKALLPGPNLRRSNGS
jgi:hypothetical protein